MMLDLAIFFLLIAIPILCIGIIVDYIRKKNSEE